MQPNRDDATIIAAYCHWCAAIGAASLDDSFALAGYLMLHPEHAGIVRRFLADAQRAAHAPAEIVAWPTDDS